jgi:LuxR family maltose regulon positive regulatory protein
MENVPTLTRSAPENWFPYTKFQPPQPGANLVLRPRLQTALLDAATRYRLTLAAAPAGSGKTILAATLAQSDYPVAWVALDATDDDLATFVALLATALQDRLQDGRQTILTFLQTVPNVQEKTGQLATVLINQLKPAPTPAILVLDDYHAITGPAIHRFLAYLLDYLPPSLRLVIVTRHDPPLPLPRLRARGQLAEIRLPQLSFDDEETARFFNQRHNLHLSSEEVAALHRRTEGWAAGLQLLASTLAAIQDGRERAAYIQRLNPAHRSVFALLAEEVLGRQPPDIQEFLLQTSILPQLTPANCQAVTQNSAAPRLLAEAYERNLFLTALAPDALNGPFLYHDLFRDFLQEQLKANAPDRWPGLHRRAAHAAANDEQKLTHLMRAELWDEAAVLLEQMGQLDTERRFMRPIVINQIETLPEAVRQTHPWLLLFAAQYYALRGYVETSAPYLAQAAARFEEQGDEPGQIEILAARAMTDALETEEIVLAFRQKVATVGDLLRPDQRIIYHGAEQWHAVAHQDWAALTRHLQAGMDYALQSGDPGALTMANLIIGPQMLFNNDGLAPVEAFVQRSLRSGQSADWILRICAQAVLGYIRFLQGRVDEAEQAIKEAHRLLQEIGGLAFVDDHVSWLILALALARRDYRAFDDFLAAQTARWETQETAASYRQGLLYLQGRSFWLRGRTAAAQTVLAQMEAIQTPSGNTVEDEECRLLLASLIAIETGNTGAAKRDLRRAAELHRRVRHTMLLTHPRLTLATLYGRQNRWEEALDELHAVLTELKTRGMPGVILQEGESIAPVLAHALKRGLEPETLQPLLHILQPAEAQTIPLPHSDQYLTPRESEVLRLLATGATNRAIAAKLFVTERTVKAHVTRILTKLDATTRTEAVTTARRLGLI